MRPRSAESPPNGQQALDGSKFEPNFPAERGRCASRARDVQALEKRRAAQHVR